MPEIKDRYDFANGWSIVIDRVTEDEVFFQRWPPGVDRQSFVAGLVRMPIKSFERQVAEAEAAHA